jgi:hypothetical protein
MDGGRVEGFRKESGAITAIDRNSRQEGSSIIVYHQNVLSYTKSMAYQQ